MEVKLEIFTIFDKFALPAAILASNTSSLSITRARGNYVSRGELHRDAFLQSRAEDEAAGDCARARDVGSYGAACAEVGRRMGKEVVVIRESPGFITSRINAMIGNEAFYMLQEGIASAEDIDKALKLGLNHPMGPFELVDLVGLDVRLNILEYLHKTLGEKYRPSPLLSQYVKAGRLGRKSGRGVYDYRGDAAKK